jgi:hypothetical protein
MKWTNRHKHTKADRSTTTTKTTTTPTASGRPLPEADQICRTQKTGNINGRGISETQDGLVIKDLNYKR